jgi:hypothetical protein
MERKQNVEGLFIKTNQTLFMVFKTRFILTVKTSYKCPFISPFCLPSGKADDTPISGSCVHKSMPKLTVDYYGFALGRLGSGVSSTFAPSGLY